MEACGPGQALIITQYIYGQEKGNMRFVVDNGWLLPDHARPGRRGVERIFSEPERLERLKANIERATLRNGTFR
jgi:hypothetical protein